MTKLIRNPSGVVTEIDDDETFRKCMAQRGFEYVLPDSPEAKAYYLQRSTPTPITDHTEEAENTSIYDVQLAAPAPHHDGYGQMMSTIETSLLAYGVRLNHRYTGQKIGIAFGYPEQLENLKTEIKILFTMFESTKVPDEWIPDLRKADLILVPSEFCKRAFEEVGIETKVCPLGYDSATFDFKAKNPDKEPFIFLMYDAFNQRKGWDIVFKAFNEEFRSESARLILKSTKTMLPFPILKSEYPQIQVIREPYTHKALAELIQNSDCFVLPSRGEGFGIPPLEALATGTPVIIPNAHGFSEFFTREYFFEANIEKEVPALYERFKGQNVGKMVEVDVKSLREQMRFVYEHRTFAFDMAKKGSEWVKTNWSFNRMAERLAPIIKEVSEKKVDKNTGREGVGSSLNAGTQASHSIIVLTYNALNYTKKCLESIEQNTKGNFELIVIENNSSDETAEWLKTFEQKPRSYHLTVVYSKENLGVAGGRNEGLKYATGDLITFLDNDTEVSEGWQNTIQNEFEDKEVGVVGKGGQGVAFMKPIKFIEPRKDERGRAVCDVVPGYCFTFRRDLLGIVGPQFDDFPFKTFWHEDLEFCIRVQMAGYKILSSDEIQVKHYEHKSVGENVSNKEMVETVKGFYENAAFIQERMISDNIVYIYRDWGGFDNAASYDRVANSLADGLRKEGMIVIRRPSFQFGPAAFTLCKGFDILHRGKRFIWLHQENDRCPLDWQKPMKHVDFAFAASPHVLDVCKDEPYFDKLINVSPDGIDDSIYNMEIEPLDDFYPDKFKFLMVGATQPRKNTQNLIKWYCETFTSKDKVVLILKDVGYGQQRDTQHFIREITKGKANAPEIAHIYEDWTSQYLARVYRTVAENGIYIHPHKAECFGLPHIEAIACGCRVGTTNWGGPKYNLKGLKTVTFFDYELSESRFHNHPGEPYYAPDEKPLWADPDEMQVKKFMIDSLKIKYDLQEAEKSSKLIIDKFSYSNRAKLIRKELKKWTK